MEKNLRKCYELLDLPYSSTEEEVASREKAMIKIFIAKADEENKSYDQEINDVKSSAKNIITNIKNNGIPKEKHHHFETSRESLISLLIVLMFMGAICFLSFYVLL